MGGGGNATEKVDELPEVLADREAIIRDAIIRVLSSKSKEQVLSTEGKEILKEELVEAINDASGLDEPPVVAVYFTEFIVQ
jgi:flagellar FliL protein